MDKIYRISILLPLNNPFSIFQFLLQLLHYFAYPSNAVVERVKQYVHRLVHLVVHLILVSLAFLYYPHDFIFSVYVLFWRRCKCMMNSRHMKTSFILWSSLLPHPHCSLYVVLITQDHLTPASTLLLVSCGLHCLASSPRTTFILSHCLDSLPRPFVFCFFNYNC